MVTGWASLFSSDPLHGAIVSALGADSWPSVLTTQDCGKSWREVSVPASPVDGAHLALPTPLAAILLAHDGDLVLSLTAFPPSVSPASVIGPFGDARSGMVLRWSSVSRDGGLTWWPWAAEPTPDDGQVRLQVGGQIAPG